MIVLCPQCHILLKTKHDGDYITVEVDRTLNEPTAAPEGKPEPDWYVHQSVNGGFSISGYPTVATREQAESALRSILAWAKIKEWRKNKLALCTNGLGEFQLGMVNPLVCTKWADDPIELILSLDAQLGEDGK